MQKITPNQIGSYQLICTELCGAEHTTMRANVVVETREDYEKWLVGLEAEVPESLLLTADQAIELERQIQEAEQGIEGSGVDETSAENVDQS